MAKLSERIGFIGAGKMATALARGLVRAGLVDASAITASDVSAESRASFSEAVTGSSVTVENAEVARDAEVLVLAVKPQQIADVLAKLSSLDPEQTLVVSIAAGVTLEKLSARLPEGTRIIRVMPNTPCLIGKGACGFALGTYATEQDGQLVGKILAAVGSAHEVPESMLDAVTGLSGSGPAFVYSVIEALAEGGVEAGLPEDLAAHLAVNTVAGAAEMVLATGEDPAVLRKHVMSPGGTTVAGLEALDKHDLRRALQEAVRAATHRSVELGKDH